MAAATISFVAPCVGGGGFCAFLRHPNNMCRIPARRIKKARIAYVGNRGGPSMPSSRRPCVSLAAAGNLLALDRSPLPCYTFTKWVAYNSLYFSLFGRDRRVSSRARQSFPIPKRRLLSWQRNQQSPNDHREVQSDGRRVMWDRTERTPSPRVDLNGTRADRVAATAAATLKAADGLLPAFCGPLPSGRRPSRGG